MFPNTECHAVLALLSEGYPPLGGRSPTRYSPVCHSTYPLRDFRVRLACVRHAASVDSEPGSNSQVKFVDSSTRPPGRASECNLFNPRSLVNWLFGLPRFRQALRPDIVRALRLSKDSSPDFRQTSRPDDHQALPTDTRRAVLARSIQFSKNRALLPSRRNRLEANLSNLPQNRRPCQGSTLLFPRMPPRRLQVRETSAYGV